MNRELVVEKINTAIAEFIGRKAGDFFNSLDAMHEAEKSLGNDLMIKYIHSNLREVTGGHSRVRATSCQRAKAFLLTIGQWKEEWNALL